MSLLPISLALLSFLSLTTSTPTNLPPPQRNCITLQVPIPVTATNHHYTQPRIDSTTDAVHWTLNTTTWSTPNATSRITGPVPVNQTFSIHAQLCLPSLPSPRLSTLQILTPGRGFDTRYFDVPFSSYTSAALDHGYAVLSYDRLGSGASEKPDAYDVVQVPVHTEILAGLTKLARSGELLTVSKVISATGDAIKGYKPTKIVHVGHSYGSFLTFNFLYHHGEMSDGAVLTGFIIGTRVGTIDVSHFDHEFAHPPRFQGYGSGYFVLTGGGNLQKLFFRKGGFDEDAAVRYTEEILQPEAVGEYASEEQVRVLPLTKFKGPALLMAGEFDYVLCGGDCRGTVLEEETGALFPGGAEVYLQPGTGHALTLARNATGGFEVMFGFLEGRGL